MISSWTFAMTPRYGDLYDMKGLKLMDDHDWTFVKAA